MNTDPCRFCRLYALSLPPIAVLLGLLLTWSVALLAQPQTLDLAPGVHHLEGGVASGAVLVSLLRSVAPAANGSALLIALVLWAHPLPLPKVSTDLPAVLQRSALVSVPGFVVAAVVSWAASWAFGWALDLPARAFAASALPASEVGSAVLASAVDAAVVVFAAWRGLLRLQAARFSLPAKLALAWTVLFPVRAVVGLVLESVLPG